MNLCNAAQEQFKAYHSPEWGKDVRIFVTPSEINSVKWYDLFREGLVHSVPCRLEGGKVIEDLNGDTILVKVTAKGQAYAKERATAEGHTTYPPEVK